MDLPALPDGHYVCQERTDSAQEKPAPKETLCLCSDVGRNWLLMVLGRTDGRGTVCPFRMSLCLPENPGQKQMSSVLAVPNSSQMQCMSALMETTTICSFMTVIGSHSIPLASTADAWHFKAAAVPLGHAEQRICICLVPSS